jgi:hypothetical protein
MRRENGAGREGAFLCREDRRLLHGGSALASPPSRRGLQTIGQQGERRASARGVGSSAGSRRRASEPLGGKALTQVPVLTGWLSSRSSSRAPGLAQPGRSPPRPFVS